MSGLPHQTSSVNLSMGVLSRCRSTSCQAKGAIATGRCRIRNKRCVRPQGWESMRVESFSGIKRHIVSLWPSTSSLSHGTWGRRRSLDSCGLQIQPAAGRRFTTRYMARSTIAPITDIMNPADCPSPYQPTRTANPCGSHGSGDPKQGRNNIPSRILPGHDELGQSSNHKTYQHNP
jgi:hypothetical protein